MPLFKSALISFVSAISVAGLQAHALQSDDLAQRRSALNDLLAEQWTFNLHENPEFATSLGDYRWNDKWQDQSIAGQQKVIEKLTKYLKRYNAISAAGFTEEEALNKALSVQSIKDQIEAYNLKLYLMPVTQQDGVELSYPQDVETMPFDTVRHYEDYVARLDTLPLVLDQLIDVMKEGIREKMMPPKYLMPALVKQCRSIADPAGESSAFGKPVTAFPDSIPVAERARLHDSIIRAIDQKVRPAYLKLARFIETDYAPFGRTEVGIWSLPNGDRIYRFMIWLQTTTRMAPEAIHQLGLREVHRIDAEMIAVAKHFGFKDRKSFQGSLRKNPKMFVATREEYLDLYRKYIAQMEPMLPKLFGLQPKSKVIVESVQPYREAEASSAEYDQGTPDGTRPGRVLVNTSDLAHRSILTVESTTYHESIPGHHMQISIAQTLPDLPPFRQQSSYTAYVEGWALYAEQLGKEIGFYQDPLSYYGRLTDEMLRACRLVLDTGVHFKKWSRKQMVDYFHDNSNEDEPNVQSETDRYIATPAQALAYKIGQLDILRLREKAKKELGAKFDIRAFHDQVLNGGSLPLYALDQRIERWILAQK